MIQLDEAFGFMILGMIAYLIIDFATYRKGLHDKTHSFGHYIHLNYLFMVAGLIIGSSLILLMWEGELESLKHMNFLFPGASESPNATAFIFGLLNQWLVIKVRKYLKSLKIEQPE